MGMQDGNAERAGRRADRAGRMQMQMFRRLGEPAYTPLVYALMQRAGLNPATVMGGRDWMGAQRERDGIAGPGSQGEGLLFGAAGGGLAGGLPGNIDLINQKGRINSDPVGRRIVPGAGVRPTNGQGISVGAPAVGVGQTVPGVQQGAAVTTPNASGIASPYSQLAMALGGGGAAGGAGALGGGGGKNKRRGQGQPPILPAPGSAQPPPPSNLPNGQPGSGVGWTDADRMKFAQGQEALESQYNRIGNQAMHGLAGRGLAGSSIQAGLAAKLAADQGQAVADLSRDISLQGIEEERKRLLDLLNALGIPLGYPGQVAATSGQQAVAGQQQGNPWADIAGLATIFA